MYTQTQECPSELAGVEGNRPDLVIRLMNQGAVVMGIIVEVQLVQDEDKRFLWPAYVANLRARLECPVVLLVVAPDMAVARWARQPIEIGPGSSFVPYVVDPENMPAITDPAKACEDPELAVLSATMHGKSPDTDKAAQIIRAALAACSGLDSHRAKTYVDIIQECASEAALHAVRQELDRLGSSTETTRCEGCS
jgi:hypothetical protein